MSIISRYSLRQIIPIFLISVLFFVLILEIIEIVINLISYIELDVPIADVGRILLYALPRTLLYALPIAILFSISFSIGNMHGNNELQAVFGIGRSLASFCTPIVFFALLLSIAALIFEDRVVVQSQRNYQQLKESALLINSSADNSNIAVFGEDGIDIYYAEFFNAQGQSLENLIIIERNRQGEIVRRIDARSAVWQEESYWRLFEVTSYTWGANGQVEYQRYPAADAPNFNTSPSIFASAIRDVDELTLREVREHIAQLQRSGLPYREVLTQYYSRYAFSTTPLVLAIISCGIGALLRRNTLILSMVMALCSAVVYYVVGLVTELLAYNFILAPIVAAWFPVVLFTVTGTVVLIRYAKT